MTIKSLNITQALSEARSLIQSDEPLSKTEKSAIQVLIDAVVLLTNRVNTNSGNSSIPPAMDPNRPRKRRSQSKGKKRKPGGQKGHKGSTLKKVEHPDEVEDIQIDRRTVPPGCYKTIGWDERQVFDILISLHVTEYRAEIIENEHGDQYVATFPESVTQAAQYGNSTKASSVYLSQFQLVPLDRVRNYFEDQAGIPISKGSIANFNTEAYQKLEKFEEWAKCQLIASPLNHADETGINVGGKRLWLHSVSNASVTLFHADEKRGKEAMDRMGILPLFCGTLCHDHWKPYFSYNCKHSLCNAHHLRELDWCAELQGQQWAKRMLDLLNEINDEKDKTGKLTQEQQSSFQKRYRTILTQGEVECPIAEKKAGKMGKAKQSKSRNLLERLRDYEEETLRFMRETSVPFTNNQGENDIRMTKVQQKISGCFRSMNGAKQFCRIRSYISTCRKNEINPTEALKLLFDGKLPTFMI